MKAGGGDQEESEGSPAPGQGLGRASHQERAFLTGIGGNRNERKWSGYKLTVMVDPRNEQREW